MYSLKKELTQFFDDCIEGCNTLIDSEELTLLDNISSKCSLQVFKEAKEGALRILDRY